MLRQHAAFGYQVGQVGPTFIEIGRPGQYDFPRSAPSMSLGEGAAALPGELVIGGDQYKKVFIAGRLVWSTETGFAWEKDMNQLKAIIKVQQMHIDELFKAMRQDYDSDQVMLPEDLQEYLESTRQ